MVPTDFLPFCTSSVLNPPILTTHTVDKPVPPGVYLMYMEALLAFLMLFVEAAAATLFAIFVLAMIPLSIFIVLGGIQIIGTAILKIFRL